MDEIVRSNEKFESIEVLRNKLLYENEFDLFYNGREYFIEIIEENKSQLFTICSKLPDELLFEFDTFDELLDNFIVDEKSAREFIPNIKKLRRELNTFPDLWSYL